MDEIVVAGQLDPPRQVGRLAEAVHTGEENSETSDGVTQRHGGRERVTRASNLADRATRDITSEVRAADAAQYRSRSDPWVEQRREVQDVGRGLQAIEKED